MARPRQISDADILHHAREVFLEHGAQASTQLVADACGLSQAALFKRFGTKRDLLLRALLPPERPPILDLVERGPEPGPLQPQLVALGIAITLYFRDAVPCMVTLSTSGVAPTAAMSGFDVPPPIRMQRAMATWFEAAADRLHPDVCPRSLGTAFLGTLHVRAFFHFLGGSGLPDDPTDYIELVVRTFLEGAALPQTEAPR